MRDSVNSGVMDRDEITVGEMEVVSEGFEFDGYVILLSVGVHGGIVGYE